MSQYHDLITSDSALWGQLQYQSENLSDTHIFSQKYLCFMCTPSDQFVHTTITAPPSDECVHTTKTAPPSVKASFSICCMMF